MTVVQIFYALEVFHNHNFSKAAENLFISQPALSLQIKRLEEELGYALFYRTPQGIFPTEDGLKFCARAQGIADNWEDFLKAVQAPGTRHRDLRIGMGSRVNSNGLFDPMVQFFEMHPELEVTFVTEAGQDFLAGLRDGTLDLALDRMPPKGLLTDLKNYYVKALISERQCVLMSSKDARSTWKEISFSQLQGCTMMTGLENSMEDRTLKQECKYYNIILKRLYRSDGIDTNMNLVQNGKGVVLGPESFAAHYGVKAVPLTPELYISLDFICLNKNSDRPEIRLLRNYLRKICEGRKNRL